MLTKRKPGRSDPSRAFLFWTNLHAMADAFTAYIGANRMRTRWACERVANGKNASGYNRQNRNFHIYSSS